MPRPLSPVFGLLLAALIACAPVRASDEWFETVKAQASPEQLYHFLYALPKGGDLHNHLSGAGLSEWWWDIALGQAERGYVYYTKVRIENCLAYGTPEYGPAPYLMLFRTLQASSYEQLDECQKSEFEPLAGLSPEQREGWMNAIRLDADHEGRNEFFGAHWQRLNDLVRNPYAIADVLYRNMEAFGREGVVYLELQHGGRGHLKPDGSVFPADEVVDLFRQRLAEADARATGVEVRFQTSILRFLPSAEEDLKDLFAFNDRHRDLYVGVNMVGREDDDKGYPLRFLPTLRELRRQYPDIKLAIHAGEVDEPNHHVRDTLLLGAMRIGHGVNLITDPETMLRMRHGPYLVEINLISNLLLEYVQDYQQHPFPEYLRTGIPVALSTDDRGMWDSNLSDEYFVAVREFNLSWEELVGLGRNSLQHSFVQPEVKQRLLADYEKRVQRFATEFQRKGWKALDKVQPVSYSFTCERYQVCLDRELR